MTTTTAVHFKDEFGEAVCGSGHCARIDGQRDQYGSLRGTSTRSGVTCRRCRAWLKAN